MSTSHEQALARLAVCKGCPRRALCLVKSRALDAAASCEHWPVAAGQEAGLVTLAARAAGEVLPWLAAGAPQVTAEVLAARTLACEGGDGQAACAHWNGAARGGLGKCAHPRCGCSKIKRSMATARCPMGKWGE